MVRTRLRLVLIVLCIMSTNIPCRLAFAEMRAVPSITLQGEYDDNIYLTRNNKKKDFITRITPSLSFIYLADGNSVYIDYAPTFINYADHSSENSTVNNLNARSSLSLYRDILMLDISDRYTRSVIDTRGRAGADTLSADTVDNYTDTNIFTIAPRLRYRLTPLLTTEAGYHFTDTRYSRRGMSDVREHGGFASADYQLTSRFKTGVRYDFVNLNFDRQSSVDYNQHSLALTAGYRLGARTELTARVGNTWVDYDGQRDRQSSLFNVAITRGFTENTTLTVIYDRNVYQSSQAIASDRGFYDSLDDSTYRSDRISARFEGRVTPRLTSTLAAYYQKDDYLNSARETEARGGDISLSWQATQKTTVTARGSYRETDYHPENRQDDLWSYGADISYRFTPRFDAGIGYIHTERDASLRDSEYADNRYTFFVRISF